jgi:hypothetical protein
MVDNIEPTASGSWPYVYIDTKGRQVLTYRVRCHKAHAGLGASGRKTGLSPTSTDRGARTAPADVMEGNLTFRPSAKWSLPLCPANVSNARDTSKWIVRGWRVIQDSLGRSGAAGANTT